VDKLREYVIAAQDPALDTILAAVERDRDELVGSVRRREREVTHE